MPTGFPDYYGGLTLPVTVPEGGTGLTTITTGALLIGEGTATMHVLAPGAAGTALLSNGAGADPSWGNPTVDVSQITGILAVAHGGTGTATPALVAGTGISLSGAWPDTTITNSSNYATLADPLPVAHGGTGTATPALVAGAGISISGSWPDQTITNSDDAFFSAGILAVAHGGTGTATPALVAGTGISLSGAWPDTTITNTSNYATLADPLPVAHGGTGTATPALVAGTGISISGSWPDQTITNSSNYATLADPLPVAHGGTGTATPALVAGSNITISGSWPDQTIALSNSIVVPGEIDTGASGSGFLKLTATGNATYIESGITSATGSSAPLHFTTMNAAATLATLDGSGNFTLAGSLTLGSPLAVAQGGTGTATPALVAGTGITITGSWPDQTIANSLPPAAVAKVHLTAQQADIAATQIGSTPAADGVYRLSAYIRITQAATTSSTLPAVELTFTDPDTGTSITLQLTATSTNNAVGTVPALPALSAFDEAPVFMFRAKSGVAIDYKTVGYASSGATPMQFALDLLLEGPF